VDSNDLDTAIANHRAALADQLRNLGVADGLDETQFTRLLDNALNLVARYELWRAYPAAKRLSKVEQRVGLQQRKMFRTKVGAALAAVNDVLKYAAKIKTGSQPNPLFAKSVDALAVPPLEQARAALKAIPLDWGNFKTVRDVLPFEDPKSDARVALMDFFTDVCGLTKSQASVRAGQIGNAVLGWAVDVVDKSESANPNRARAVLKSLQRAKNRPTNDDD
jgi:hypothetical protein